MNTSPTFFEKLFGFTDLLKSRMTFKGHEQEIGTETSKLVQISSFGKKEWNYFGLVRLLKIEKKVDKKNLNDASLFIRDFIYTMDNWVKSEEAGELSELELKEIETRFEELKKTLDQSIADGFSSQAKSSMDTCKKFMETYNISLENAPPSYTFKLTEKKQSVSIKVRDSEGNEESIEPDVLYHYELVRPRSNTPKTFTMLYDMFKYAEQRRYSETNQGQKAKNKLYRFFLLVGWILLTGVTELLTITQFTPIGHGENYFLVAAGISVMWLLVLYFFVKMIIGTTWVFYAFLLEFPSYSIHGDSQPMLLVNSKTLNPIELITSLVKGDINFVRSLGETMKSFQEYSFARLQIDYQSAKLRISALENKIKKQKILDETDLRLNGRNRVIKKAPGWAYGAFFGLVILGAINIFSMLTGGGI